MTTHRLVLREQPDRIVFGRPIDATIAHTAIVPWLDGKFLADDERATRVEWSSPIAIGDAIEVVSATGARHAKYEVESARPVRNSPPRKPTIPTEESVRKAEARRKTPRKPPCTIEALLADAILCWEHQHAWKADRQEVHPHAAPPRPSLREMWWIEVVARKVQR